MQPDRGTRAVVNLDAIVNNIKVAKRNLNVGTKLCAVVKANAYGHGAIPVAIACIEAGVDYFAVALVQEAVELREAGITKPILVLGAMPVRPSMADLCVRFNIAHAVFDEERLTLLNEAGLRRGKKAKIHIALDTGMHRIGIKIDEAAAFAEKVKAMQGIEVVGAFSHFSAADVEDKSYADYQYGHQQRGHCGTAPIPAGHGAPGHHPVRFAAGRYYRTVQGLPSGYDLKDPGGLCENTACRAGYRLRQDFYHGKRKPHRYGSHRVCGRRQPASVQ